MALKQLSDTQMEIREGGGCLSVFGLPFLGTGLLLLFAAGGLIPLESVSDFDGWARLIVVAVGLIFTVAGGLLVFGRSRLVIDTGQGVILRYRGLLSLPVQRRSFPLKAFNAVALTFEEGDSDSADSYPVILKSTDPKGNLSVFSHPDYPASFEQARQLAVFLKLPLEDASTDHQTVWAPDEVDKPLAQRLQGVSDDDVWAARPLNMQSTVEEGSGKLHIKIPCGRFRIILLLPVVILPVASFFVWPDISDSFEQYLTPDEMPWMLIGAGVLLFGLILTVLSVRSIAGRALGFTSVIIEEGRVEITQRRLWFKRVFTIQGADIYGLDYSTVRGRALQVAAEYQKHTGKTSDAYTAPPARPLPAWGRALMRLAGTKGVTIKHRHGLYTFGAGLSDDEVTYLYSLVHRALAGKL